MKGKWLITGANGQLGREWARQVAPEHLILTDREELDITEESAIKTQLAEWQPEAVIHCAAYTNVDHAESDEENAQRINTDGARYLAKACEALGIPLVYVSTDYVFDGTKKSAYEETDVTSPLGVYGRTKLAGEEAVEAFCSRHYIVRTAWLYGEGPNFVRTMLRLAKEEASLRLVADQHGTPTSTTDLVWAIRNLLEKNGPYGIYHATCQGETTWYEFAKEILCLSGSSTPVVPVTTEAFPRPAKRPCHSVLDNKRLRETVGDPMRPWQDALAQYLLECQR